MPFFKGKPNTLKGNEEAPIILPSFSFKEEADPAGYIASDALVAAINLALLMGKPLLLTGEPGTGKTQAAYRLAWELGYPLPYKFETKSTSQAKELFYTFDSFTRFQDIHSQSTKNVVAYLTFNALGKAIINGADRVQLKDIPKELYSVKPKRSVVLIDEIDKAPRDFPNDILNEIENLYFKIPELDNKKISVSEKFAPVIIITSNSEKNLPNAFLRRCIFHHIDFPDMATLEKIVAKRLATMNLNQEKNNYTEVDKIAQAAIQLFDKIRNLGLKKKPSTAELILWIKSVIIQSTEDTKLSISQRLINNLGLIIKEENKSVQEEIKKIIINHPYK